jgi:hypothetical protein
MPEEGGGNRCPRCGGDVEVTAARDTAVNPEGLEGVAPLSQEHLGRCTNCGENLEKRGPGHPWILRT